LIPPLDLAGWSGVQQRLPSLLDPPIMFAHRGARAHAPENTIEAFQLALKLGATGLESDVWLTADEEVVLDHDGEVKRGRIRKVPIASLRREELPEHIPTLSELIATCGTELHLSLDLKAPGTGDAVVDVLRREAPELRSRTWLCHPDFEALAALRPTDTEVKLVNSTRLARIAEGPERRAARLAEAGIDGVNRRNLDWNGGLVALFHRFDRTAFAWDLQFEHHLRPAYRMGIDGVYSDHVDRMYEAFRTELGTP
jgi:glycerophosphoryl diester phosphodiesterase